MNLQLKKPEFERFIQQKVDTGEFPTPEAVVEDALARAMIDEAVLSEEDLAAIKLSEEQIDRGEGIDSKEVAAHMRKKYTTS